MAPCMPTDVTGQNKWETTQRGGPRKSKPAPRGREGGRTPPVGGTRQIRVATDDAEAIAAAAKARGQTSAEVVKARDW